MRVGIISPASLLRHGLAALLAGHPEIGLAWQVERADNVSTADERPDVLLLDAGDDALDRATIEAAKARFPSARIIVLYEAPSEELMVETLLAGARRCVSKTRDGALFVKAVLCVGRDELWANRRVAASALQKGLRRAGAAPAAEGALSRREWEVFSLIAVGKRNREIAAALCISEQTVKRHLYSIYRKLNVPSRLEAGLLFYRLGRQAPPAPAEAPQELPARAMG